MDHDSIVEVMEETIAEREASIAARASTRREIEESLTFDGFSIINTETANEAIG